MKFTHRAEAGRTLAGKLQHYAGRGDTVVLALPRGGVPFRAVGEWYEDFRQTSDEEVRRLLSLARNHARQA